MRDALARHRLVTITGLGGSGKTRLALEVAASVAAHHRDGACVVELASVTTADGVADAIHRAVLPPSGRPGVDGLHALTGALRPLQLLLVLDNCEHLTADVSRTVEALVGACPQLRVLATSREPLHVAGEHLVRLDPLDVDPCTVTGPSDAVRLFLDRAAALCPGFAVDRDNVADVARICRLVDGLPLGIELAAARVSHLSVREIVQHLEEQPARLRARRPGVAARHQTLATTLDWSFALLSPVEQDVLRRLAVFAGGAGLAAIAAVCAPPGSTEDDVLDVVSRLVDKSLVIADRSATGSRYRMLDSVRRDALDRLHAVGEEDEVRRRQATWLATAGVADVDAADVLTSLAWALDAGEVDVALAVAAATWKEWEVSGRHAEGRRILEQVLERAEASPTPERAAVLVAAANLALAAGDLVAARRRYGEAVDTLAAADRPAELAAAQNGVAIVALFEGDTTAAVRSATRSLQTSRSVGPDHAGVAFARVTLGMAVARTGEHQAAEHHLLEALARFRRLGLKREAASVLDNLGNLAADAGDPHRATRFYEGALQLQRDVGDHRGAALSLNNLCLAAQQLGNLDRAWEHAEAARAAFASIHDRLGEAATVNNLANLAAERGQPAQALELYLTSVAAFREAGDVRRLATSLHNLADLAEAVDERQLAWDRSIDAVSLWNQLGEDEETRRGLGRLQALAGAWGVTGWELPALAGDGSDREAVSHALERARWVSVPVTPRPPVQRGELTPREAQVVGLVGRGLSNAGIAGELFISERTVESHIANARVKLAIDRRTVLARWAIEHGLSG
ncbi:MAG: tetratricopeptide repeat protein [Actinobacteria bacterium]|nr:tetratricopeptide repeat protein [Actinomycetota bacterium]